MVSDFDKTLYRENKEFDSRITESLVKVAEFYWEKIPSVKRRRVVLKHIAEENSNILRIEYLPKTSFELMEYAKKDYFDFKKTVEIKLEEEADKLLYSLYKSGAYSRFKTYVEKNLLAPEEVLIKMGYGKRIYEILKNSIDNLFVRKEERSKKNRMKETLKLVPFLFLIGLIFFVSTTTTGLIVLPSQEINSVVFLFFLSISLLVYLFFY